MDGPGHTIRSTPSAACPRADSRCVAGAMVAPVSMVEVSGSAPALCPMPLLPQAISI